MTGRCKRTTVEITRNICRTCVRCSLGIHAGSVFSNRVCVNPTDIYEAQITPELSIKLYLCRGMTNEYELKTSRDCKWGERRNFRVLDLFGDQRYFGMLWFNIDSIMND